MPFEEEMTAQEMMELDSLKQRELMKDSSGLPDAQVKQSVFNFFNQVIAKEENIKTANLTEEEIGFARIPVRTYLDLSNFCEAVGMKGFGNYFKKKAQTVLGTSLSREGFLNQLAVTQKRESQTQLSRRQFTEAQKKNWFDRRRQPEQQGG